ncbi:PEP-CTERM sorting domain-containing protein [Limnofasciculus baicalensis]|uniref:PEP-CTERM sorting domain-containing protein n=1 Tax=Limnofasciculus baicalensis BBK-W-15 TaxID=2699891 RepID=A0AAE3KQQ6_9CYAN|nr:PEP-CTERM sorting domain-containing protein [Limnofasciculus baicalensis]MCP2732091.1 PEP-CTERM sorting domain-containing protein [Limnofasciculus baicalensis BBK-W-15]
MSTSTLLKKLSMAAAGAAFVALGVGSTAQAAELINNGGFETGDFTNWSVTNNGSGGCDTDWHVNATGYTGCNLLSPATEGTFAAYNSFEGDGPQQFRLEQTFFVPNNITSAVLSWADEANMFIFSVLNREFQVDLVTSSGSVNIFSQIFQRGPRQYAWTARLADVTSILQANQGQSVTLAFTNIIPEQFSGPGGFGLDKVSLDVTTGESQSVPEPASVLGLLGLGGLGAASSLKRKLQGK